MLYLSTISFIIRNSESQNDLGFGVRLLKSGSDELRLLIVDCILGIILCNIKTYSHHNLL